MQSFYPIPTRDPITGGPLYVSELTAPESGTTIRGSFELPMFAKLDGEQMKFLETFLRCRGMLSCVEKELGLSYPTVRARLDGVLETLGFAPAKEEGARAGKGAEKRKAILDQLEAGEITAEEAKEKLKGARA